MDNYTIVRQEHLNHYGFLFGGAMLKWVDEFAWLTASLDYPGCTLVTMAMNDIVFRKRIVSGAILRFRILPLRKGTTSVTYGVTVFADEPGAEVEIDVFSTQVTFVRVDEQGRKSPLPVKERLRSQHMAGS